MLEKIKQARERRKKELERFFASLPTERKLFLDLFRYLDTKTEVPEDGDDFALTKAFLSERGADTDTIIEFLYTEGCYGDVEVLPYIADLFEEYDSLHAEKSEKNLVYCRETEEEFFQNIEELMNNDEFSACISALEVIPEEERDYRVSYTLARAYQNFAICGDGDRGTYIDVGTVALMRSIELLEQIREEGKDRPEWNMRMAYGHQYLEGYEETAIPYALRWAELDPSDEDALLVVEECREEIEKRRVHKEAYAIIKSIFEEFEIKDSNDYFDEREDSEFEEIDAKVTSSLKGYPLEEVEVLDLIDEVLEEIEEERKERD